MFRGFKPHDEALVASSEQKPNLTRAHLSYLQAGPNQLAIATC